MQVHAAEVTKFLSNNTADLVEATGQREVYARGLGGEPGGDVVWITNTNLDTPIVWTSGLTGCLAVGIRGVNKKTGEPCAYFAHSAHWMKRGCTDSMDDVMYWAKKFVDEHDNIQVSLGHNSETPPPSTDRFPWNEERIRGNVIGNLGVSADAVTITDVGTDANFNPSTGAMTRRQPVQRREARPVMFSQQGEDLEPHPKRKSKKKTEEQSPKPPKKGGNNRCSIL